MDEYISKEEVQKILKKNIEYWQDNIERYNGGDSGVIALRVLIKDIEGIRTLNQETLPIVQELREKIKQLYELIAESKMAKEDEKELKNTQTNVEKHVEGV